MFKRRKKRHQEYMANSIMAMRKSIVTAALLMSKETDESAIHHYNRIIITRSNLFKKYTRRHQLINF
jgi:hypothetical protein